MQTPRTMNEQHLKQCLERYRKERDPEAIGELFEETAPRLWPLAMHLARDAQDADDLLQSTFLAVIEGADRFDPEQSVQGWLVGILSNKARYQQRRRQRSADPERLIAREVPAPEEVAVNAEERGALEGAIAGLPELYRQVIELVVRQGAGPAEIAAHLGRSPGSVRTQLHRGIALLRKALPAGMALPLALVAIESVGLKAVRDAVLRHAAQQVGTRVALGGLSKGALLLSGAGLLSLGAFALLLRPDERDLEPPVELALSGKDPSGASSPPTLPELGETESGREPEERGPREQAPPPRVTEVDPLSAVSETFEVRLSKGEGYSFARGEVVAAEEADFFLDERDLDVVGVAPGGGLLVLPTGRRILDERDCSPDCHLRSVVALRPDQGRWTKTHEMDRRDPSSKALGVRGAGDHWGVIASVNEVWDTQSRRFVRIIRGISNPIAPVFGRERGRHEEDRGVVFDPRAFQSDPFRDELDRLCAQELARLDRATATAEHRAWPVNRGDSRVRGILTRRHAATISKEWSYGASTFSFEHDTRDDVELTRNDWELQLDGEGESLDIRMVTSDRSELWHLGNQGLEVPSALDLPAPHEHWRGPRKGDVFLIHTLDSETDRWDVVKVLEMRTERWMIFQWVPFEDEAWLDSLQARRASDLGTLGDDIFLQIRSDDSRGGNPLRAFFDGTVNGYVDQIENLPLDRRQPHNPGAGSRAFIRGGRIPPDKVWEIRGISFHLTSLDDPDRSPPLRILAAGQVLVEVTEREPVFAGDWSGNVVLEPGDAAKAFVEIRGASQCEVLVMGRFLPAPRSER